MIKYIEHGTALHVAVAKAGFTLRELNGTWVSSDDTAVQAIIDSFDALASAIADKKAAIDTYANVRRKAVLVGTAEEERASWGTKYAQAKAYLLSNDPADAPALAQEANDAASSIADIVARVIRNGDAFTTAEANIAGVAARHKRIVENLTDFQEVINYDFTAWW